MKKILKDTLALAIITIVSGVLLGGVYLITKEPIEKQNEKTKIAAYNSVFSDLSTYEMYDDLESLQAVVKDSGYSGVIVDEVVYAYNSSKENIGVIVTITDKDGYGGNIKMTVGIDMEGTITGLEILEI